MISMTSSRMNCWKKLMTNKRTRRLYVGKLVTKLRLSSADFEQARASLYDWVGTTGSSSSRSHSLNNEAPTCGSSMPFYPASELHDCRVYVKDLQAGNALGRFET